MSLALPSSPHWAPATTTDFIRALSLYRTGILVYFEILSGPASSLSATTLPRRDHHYAKTALESTKKRQVLIVSSPRLQRKRGHFRSWVGAHALAPPAK